MNTLPWYSTLYCLSSRPSTLLAQYGGRAVVLGEVFRFLGPLDDFQLSWGSVKVKNVLSDLCVISLAWLRLSVFADFLEKAISPSFVRVVCVHAPFGRYLQPGAGSCFRDRPGSDGVRVQPRKMCAIDGRIERGDVGKQT
jgi:hypothetical protein